MQKFDVLLEKQVTEVTGLRIKAETQDEADAIAEQLLARNTWEWDYDSESKRVASVELADGEAGYFLELEVGDTMRAFARMRMKND